jgi:hypothetical protein
MTAGAGQNGGCRVRSFILEFILLNIDAVMAAVRRKGYDICDSLVPVNRYKW